MSENYGSHSHRRPRKSEALRLELRDVCYKKPSKWFWCPKVLRTVGVQDDCLGKRLGEEKRDRENRTSIKGRVWRCFLFKSFLSLGAFTLAERNKVFPFLLSSSGCSKKETDMRLKRWVPFPGVLKSSHTIVLYVSVWKEFSKKQRDR